MIVNKESLYYYFVHADDLNARFRRQKGKHKEDHFVPAGAEFVASAQNTRQCIYHETAAGNKIKGYIL
jgi:hypothetical protein